MSARGEALDVVKVDEGDFEFEALFRSHYGHIARVIARVVRDPARADELAVEVFLKLWRTPQAQGESAKGWLYRVAVRKGLDELRRRTRWARYESLISPVGRVPNPEETHAAAEEQKRVRLVLAAIGSREAELLLLRGHDLSYDELASALGLNPASIGTLLARAQQAFRKEYVRRYGQE